MLCNNNKKINQEINYFKILNFKYNNCVNLSELLIKN